MNTRPILLATLLLAALPAVAQQASPVPAAAPAPAPAADAQVEPTAAPATVAAPAPDTLASADKHCLRETGTRIRAQSSKNALSCAGNGRAYTQDDLRRTGYTDIADALRALDPAIR